MFDTVHKGDRSLIGNNSEFAPQEIMRPFSDRFYKQPATVAAAIRQSSEIAQRPNRNSRAKQGNISPHSVTGNFL